MIQGLGIDLVELSRIKRSLERFGERFCRKILHTDELRFAPALDAPPSIRLVEWLGGRFAAKEAAFKALGTGMANGIVLHDIRIIPDTAGKPQIFFYGKARERMHALQAAFAHVSLTHTRTSAAAVVILE